MTYNWGKDDDYDKGDGYGHIAIGVPDIYGLCEMLEKEGAEIPRPAGPLKHGGPNASIIAFVKDPDQTVGQVLAAAGEAKVSEFLRFKLGEGGE